MLGFKCWVVQAELMFKRYYGLHPHLEGYGPQIAQSGWQPVTWPPTHLPMLTISLLAVTCSAPPPVYLHSVLLDELWMCSGTHTDLQGVRERQADWTGAADSIHSRMTNESQKYPKAAGLVGLEGGLEGGLKGGLPSLTYLLIPLFLRDTEKRLSTSPRCRVHLSPVQARTLEQRPATPVPPVPASAER